VSRAALAEALAASQSAVRWWEQARVVPPARGQEILRAVAHLRGRCTAERPLSAAIAKHLCAMRVAAGRAQAELAEELGISQSTVANWEAGRGLTRQNARRVHLALCRLGAAPRVDGHLLRAFRARHGWSQSELALRLGVGVATIKRWEAGRIAVPAHRAASILAVVGA
jgi:DNA-binding transcriptional regulator YiaG